MWDRAKSWTDRGSTTTRGRFGQAADGWADYKQAGSAVGWVVVDYISGTIFWADKCSLLSSGDPNTSPGRRVRLLQYYAVPYASLMQHKGLRGVISRTRDVDADQPADF